MFGARSDQAIAPAATGTWALAGRLAVPSARDTPVERWELDATLSGASGDVPGAEVHETVEVRRPSKARGDQLLVEIPVALRLPALELAPGDYGWQVVAGGDIFEYLQFTVRKGAV
jgi:hypothetical protein